uniref:Lactoylglutathione lyase n=1 Tax=Wollemia nobilis TaxID=56998 RepID=A0A0C9RQR9_9CONI
MARMVTMASSSSVQQLAAARLPSFVNLKNPNPNSVRVLTPLAPGAQSRRLAPLHLGGGFHQARFFGIRTSNNMRIEGNMAQAGAMVSQESLQEWSKKDNRRLLHVVYRVGDLDKTIKFYTECLGMKLLRKRDIPEERYTNAFLGFGPEESHFVVELTYNYGVNSYNLGTGFGHFGIAVEDVPKAVELVRAKGGKISREPGPVKGGKSVIAFVEDPDGYKFELIERGPTPEPLCQVMLRVGDLDRAIDFYEKAYGMELLRKRDNPDYKYTIAMMGYGPEDKSTVLELTYNYGVKEYDKGNAYAQIAIGTDDVYRTAEAVRLAGGKITREPGPLPGISTKITACLDPDGWKTVFVDNADFFKELEL